LPFADTRQAAGPPPSDVHPPSDLRPVVELTINGRTCLLLVDTGDTTSIIASDVLRQAGLSPATEIPWAFSNAYGGPIRLKRSTSPRVDFGFASLTPFAIDVIDRAMLDPTTRTDGALGLDLLQAFHATIDYSRRTLTLRLPPPAGSPVESSSSPRPPAGPGKPPLPLRIDQGHLLCEVPFDGAQRTFCVDSGFRGDVPILISSSGARLLGLNTKGTTPAHGHGYGGNFEGILLEASVHSIGTGQMRGQSIVVVPKIIAGELAVGVLGSEFLRIAGAKLDFQTMQLTIPTS
jgi:predicted aspartyl protease